MLHNKPDKAPMPHTDKLVWNFSTMWELLNVNCNYKLIRSSQIQIAVKMIDSQSSVLTNSSDQDETELWQCSVAHRSNLQCVSYPPSLTVLLHSTSYNLGDNLGSLPSTHNQSFGGKSVLGISISYLDLACCSTTTMQTLP